MGLLYLLKFSFYKMFLGQKKNNIIASNFRLEMAQGNPNIF